MLEDEFVTSAKIIISRDFQQQIIFLTGQVNHC